MSQKRTWLKWFAVWSTTLLIGTACFVCSLLRYSQNETTWWYVLVLAYPITGLTALFLQSKLLVKIPAESLVFKYGKHPTVFFATKTWLWKWEYKELLSGEKTVLCDCSQTHVRIIVETNNSFPLRCEIYIVRKGGKENFIPFWHLLEKQDQLRTKNLENYADWLGYEFIREERIALEKFTNPADKHQQDQYKILLSTFLRSKIGEADFLHIGIFSRFDLSSRFKQEQQTF